MSKDTAPRAAQREFVVRQARLNDCVEMADVHIKAWQAGYRCVMDSDYLAKLSVKHSADRWRSILSVESANGQSSTGAVVHLVAELSGHIVGICTAGTARDDVPADTGELQMLNVLPRCWSTGVGGFLHNTAMSELVDLGYLRAYLWVAEKNSRASGFYSHRGWRQSDSTRTDHRVLPPVREIRLDRPLVGFLRTNLPDGPDGPDY